MKKLLYSGLSALMMLLALIGVGKAQTVTFSPDPNDGTVAANQEITITYSGNATVYYRMYSSLTDAQNDPIFNGSGSDDAFYDAYDDGTIIQYSQTHPVITTGKTVIRVGLHDDGWVKTDIYAEYTIASSGPSVTFSPAPEDGAVAANQEITINYSGNGTVYYRMYSSLTDAQNDPIFNGSGSDDAFYDAYDDGTIIQYSQTHPVITTGKTVIRVGLHDDGWVKTDIYAEYTIAGGETPGPEPTTPAVPLTFKPGTGTEVVDHSAILIQTDEPADIYYRLYASLEAAQADNDNWSGSDKTNLVQYSAKTAPKITQDSTVIKAAAWLTDKWDVFSYAEYTIQATTPTPTVPDYTLAFSPDNDNNVEAGQFITITPSPELANNNHVIYYQLYATTDAADAAVWPAGTMFLDENEVVLYGSQNRPQITNEKPVLRAGVYNRTTGVFAWIASSKTVKEYTIGQTREPFVISFAPEASEEVDANTSVTLSTTPALSEGFELYYQMFASESAAKGATWTSGTADAPEYGTMTKFTRARTPIITDTMPVVRAAVWNATTYLWESDTVVTYTVKQVEEPIVLTFNPASGTEVEEGDTVKIECSDEEAVIYFMMFDTKASAESFSDEDWAEAVADEIAILYDEPVEDDETVGYPVITKEKPVIKAGYAIVDEDANITWHFTYAEYTVKEETPDPDKVAAPTFSVAAGAVDSNTVVTIAKGTADSIFVAFGKTVEEAVAFAKHTANVTVTIVKDTVIRAYAMKDGKYSDTIDRAYTLKPAVTVQDTVETPTFSVAGEVEKGTKVTIACATEGAKIYYTVNGDVPTAQSTEYTAQIVIDSAMTIKAIAVKEGSVDSKVAEASYTIKTVANEGAELAGIRLYPNPNNGEFNVSVPVRVQVEVFTVNGMLVKDMTIAQGNTQIRLENSGIYFVRFTAENGQAAVKRVIVR